jgi:DNA-binding Xre family transcriptional regulator
MNEKKTPQDYEGRIYTRFKVLVAEKEIKDSRKYTYDDIKKATGIARSTLSAYAQNKSSVRAYKKATLAKLCIFFECDLGDLIVFENK